MRTLLPALAHAYTPSPDPTPATYLLFTAWVTSRNRTARNDRPWSVSLSLIQRTPAQTYRQIRVHGRSATTTASWRSGSALSTSSQQWKDLSALYCSRNQLHPGTIDRALSRVTRYQIRRRSSTFRARYSSVHARHSEIERVWRTFYPLPAEFSVSCSMVVCAVSMGLAHAQQPG